MPAAFSVADAPESPNASPSSTDAVDAPPPPATEFVDPPNRASSQSIQVSPVRVGRFPGSYCWSLDCPNCGFPNFYFRADALYLRRNNGSINQPVVLQDGTGATLLATHTSDFDFRWGQSYVIGYRPNPIVSWEASYYSVQGWSASAVAAEPSQLDLPLPLSAGTFDYFGADAMRLSYRTQLHNIEANGLRSLNDWFSVLAGFRYLNLNERFNINSSDSTYGTSDYNVHTNNNLIGGQIGSRLQRCWGRLGLSLTGKAGLFGNAIHQRQLIGDLNNTLILRDVRSDGDRFSFVSDLSLLATCRLTENFALRGGYNLILINQVALAPDQLDFSVNSVSGRRLNCSGDVFLHGVNLGLEARW